MQSHPDRVLVNLLTFSAQSSSSRFAIYLMAPEEEEEDASWSRHTIISDVIIISYTCVEEENFTKVLRLSSVLCRFIVEETGIERGGTVIIIIIIFLL